jgi:hypothetical protein
LVLSQRLFQPKKFSERFVPQLSTLCNTYPQARALAKALHREGKIGARCVLFYIFSLHSSALHTTSRPDSEIHDVFEIVCVDDAPRAHRITSLCQEWASYVNSVGADKSLTKKALALHELSVANEIRAVLDSSQTSNGFFFCSSVFIPKAHLCSIIDAFVDAFLQVIHAVIQKEEERSSQAELSNKTLVLDSCRGFVTHALDIDAFAAGLKLYLAHVVQHMLPGLIPFVNLK